MRNIFCDFIEGLNSKNISYCELLQQSFDESLRKVIAGELQKVIMDIFHVNLSLNDLSIHIPIEVIDWGVDNFKPGGAWYNNFTSAIDNASSRWNFSWDIARDSSEASSIANGVKNWLTGLNMKEMTTYPQEIISHYGQELKSQTMEIACELFFENQLFQTTFAEANN